ncbi:glycosyltransferase [Candidatus Daviesbacteria bacterium]|nr:glycosyltransferase [Candidatus Daviesbacteria bacterium]
MKPKIAVVIDQILPGGVQKAAIEEVKELNKLGFHATLLILMRRGFEKRNSYLVANIPHEFLSDRYPKILQSSFKLPIFKFLSSLHLVSPILAPIKVGPKEFDIIISHGTTTSLTIWALCHFRHIPYIAVIHDPMVYILEKVYSETMLRLFFPIIKPIASFLEKHFIQASNLCLVDSTVHANFIKNSYRVNPTILYLGVNPPKNLPKKRGDKIISFGRWDREKNLDILLELLEQLPQTELIIAGTWSSKHNLTWFRKLIKQKQLQNRVTLITGYKQNELEMICNQARVWIHPHFEAFSLSALEAASLGIPIIIPKRSGITELFQNNKHGFFPNQISANILKKFVEILLKDERRAYKMGVEAAKLVKLYYTHLQHTLSLVKLINDILKHHQPKFIALETGHIAQSGIAGGDLLLVEMAKRLALAPKISVVLPETNTSHWVQSGLKINLIKLKRTVFDNHTGPWGVFITYLLRIISSTKLLKKISESKIIYSSTSILPDILPAYLTKKAGVYWIARIHHLSPSPFKRPGRLWVNLGSSFLQWVSLQAIKQKADLIIALNQNLKNQLHESGFNAQKVIVLGGGVDYQAIKSFRPAWRKKYDGVFLGRLHPTKGIFDLPKIWVEVTKKSPQAKLAVIGPGPNNILRELRLQIKNFGLGDNIKLLGFIPQPKVWSILKTAKVFLFTDHEAGWGLAVGEAMAAKLPVIGWDIGVLETVYKKGYRKVPLGDYYDFANKVIRILTDNIYRIHLSKKAEFQASKLTWEKISLKFAAILQIAMKELRT